MSSNAWHADVSPPSFGRLKRSTVEILERSAVRSLVFRYYMRWVMYRSSCDQLQPRRSRGSTPTNASRPHHPPQQQQPSFLYFRGTLPTDPVKLTAEAQSLIRTVELQQKQLEAKDRLINYLTAQRDIAVRVADYSCVQEIMELREKNAELVELVVRLKAAVDNQHSIAVQSLKKPAAKEGKGSLAKVTLVKSNTTSSLPSRGNHNSSHSQTPPTATPVAEEENGGTGSSKSNSPPILDDTAPAEDAEDEGFVGVVVPSSAPATPGEAPNLDSQLHGVRSESSLSDTNAKEDNSTVLAAAIARVEAKLRQPQKPSIVEPTRASTRTAEPQGLLGSGRNRNPKVGTSAPFLKCNPRGGPKRTTAPVTSSASRVREGTGMVSSGGTLDLVAQGEGGSVLVRQLMKEVRSNRVRTGLSSATTQQSGNLPDLKKS